MEWLNYDHLRYFWAVAREGSVTRDAEKLHISQPTVSAQIRELEEALGERLFTRTGRTLALTDVGRTLFRFKTGGGQTGYIAAWFAADQALQAFPPSGLIGYPFDTLPMRSGPGLGLAQTGVAASTTPLNVLGNSDSARAKVGQKDQWMHVLAPDGRQGFVPAWLVRVTGDNPPPTGLFVTPLFDLNLRAAPSTDADIMAVLTQGEPPKMLGDKNQASGNTGKKEQWINVQAPKAVIGWVPAWLVIAAPEGVSSSVKPAPFAPCTTRT